MRSRLALAALLLLPGALAAQRQRLSMDADWRFQLGDAVDAQAPGFNDKGWRRVDLPHDWSIEGTPSQQAPGGGRMGYFPTGIGWYRKAFRLPASGSRSVRAWLEFDGVYMNGDVWLNGKHLGKRPYGYSSFAYDVTGQLKSGNNVLAVRVDNSKQPNSRWYSGSGVYRHVWLTIADPLHVGHWGVYVTTPHVDSTGADVVVRTRLENGRFTPGHGVLRTVVFDSGGREVARDETPVSLPAGQRYEIRQRLRVSEPALWSVDRPSLYTLRSELVDNTRSIDLVTTRFGIRTIRYDQDQGFLLNGRGVKIGRAHV